MRQAVRLPTVVETMFPVFEGARAVPLRFRLRYRAGERGLMLWFVLDNAEAVKQAAFDDFFAEATWDIPVLNGTR